MTNPPHEFLVVAPAWDAATTPHHPAFRRSGWQHSKRGPSLKATPGIFTEPAGMGYFTVIVMRFLKRGRNFLEPGGVGDGADRCWAGSAWDQTGCCSSFRRRRPTPPPCCTAESRQQRTFGVEGLDVAHGRGIGSAASVSISPSGD